MTIYPKNNPSGIAWRACPKPQRIVDQAYRRSAKDRKCMVRHPETGEHCNGEPVLCHINIAGNFGTALKAGDDESVDLCGRHHDEFDSRNSRPMDRTLWLIRNILIPERKAAYREWNAARKAR